MGSEMCIRDSADAAPGAHARDGALLVEARRLGASAHLELAALHEASAAESAAAGSEPSAATLRRLDAAVEAAECAHALVLLAAGSGDAEASAQLGPVAVRARQSALRQAIAAHAKAGNAARADALKAAYRAVLAGVGANPPASPMPPRTSGDATP